MTTDWAALEAGIPQPHGLERRPRYQGRREEVASPAAHDPLKSVARAAGHHPGNHDDDDDENGNDEAQRHTTDTRSSTSAIRVVGPADANVPAQPAVGVAPHDQSVVFDVPSGPAVSITSSGPDNSNRPAPGGDGPVECDSGCNQWVGVVTEGAMKLLSIPVTVIVPDR